MSGIQSSLTLLLFCLVSSIFVSTVSSHECLHDRMNFQPEILDMSSEEEPEGRLLQEYSSIRVTFDFSMLTKLDNKTKNYIMYNVVLPTKNYLESALYVRRSSKNITINATTTCSGSVTVPSAYKTDGIDTDLLIFVTAANESAYNYVAYAGACLIDSTNNRPVVGVLHYNIPYVQPAGNTAKLENDMVVTVHEVTHVLGFSSGLFPYFVDPSTNQKLTGHFFNKTINGVTSLVLNLPTLTYKLREYFNCSTLEGAYLENEGGAGSAGSHFERRIFYNEYMTASTILDLKISSFTLALLEGTGWYKVDYGMAEVITYGKGKGCSFLNLPCVDEDTFETVSEEFCPTLGISGCSWTGRGGAVCGIGNPKTTSATLNPNFNYWGNNSVVNDKFIDNCPIWQNYYNMDCENPTHQINGAIPDYESYGVGSKCFVGTLFTSGSLSANYSYCFKTKCITTDDGTYQVKVTIGSDEYTCTKEEQIGVSSLYGKLVCPDPAKFCAKEMASGWCKRKCTGKGDCINDSCVCDEGWSGADCSQRIYVHNCSRCTGNDFQTSCAGDQCVCDPKNKTCTDIYGIVEGSSVIFDPTAIVSTSSSTATTGSTSSSATTLGSSTTVSSNSTANMEGEEGRPELPEVNANPVLVIAGFTAIVIVIIGALLGLRYYNSKKTVESTRVHTRKATVKDEPEETPSKVLKRAKSMGKQFAKPADLSINIEPSSVERSHVDSIMMQIPSPSVDASEQVIELPFEVQLSLKD